MFKASLFCIAFLITTSASAQSLKVPTIIFASAAATDWVTTYQAHTTMIHVREANPMIGWLHSTPKVMVLTGAALDVAGVMAWNRYMGRKHPKIAVAGLYAATAMRIFFAAHNTRVGCRNEFACVGGTPLTR